jgi:uncharacterized membrane protein
LSSTTINAPATRKSLEAESSFAETHPQRFSSVDLLRGLVMVLMALDHTRDFFSNAFFNPLDLAQTTPALFFTRWITHYCAPIFVLLAGTGAYLYGVRGRTNAEVARFLFTRGLLLVLIEFTLVHFGWFFSFDYHFLLAQVIWMIGWSMVVLAGLILLRLPLWAMAGLGVLMIAGHNLLDNLSAGAFGSLQWIWIILHQPNTIELVPGRVMLAFYPLVPWIGVMAVGYALGNLFLFPPPMRQKWLLGLGLAATLAFIVLRWINLYGDPQPWTPQTSPLFTFLSFINTDKYPPSLLFLLMTLGPAFLLLALFERVNMTNVLARALIIFGQVPLFYYVLHLIVIHAVAVMFSYAFYGDASWLFGTDWMFRAGLPEGYGYGLPIVYLVWLSVVILLYPICYWFAQFKKRSRSGWLSYF